MDRGDWLGYSPSIGSRRVRHDWATKQLSTYPALDVAICTHVEPFLWSFREFTPWFVLLGFFPKLSERKFIWTGFFFFKLSSCVYFKSYRLYRKHNYLTKYFIWNKHCYIFIPSFSLHSPCIHCRSGHGGWKGHKDGPCDPFPQIALDLTGMMGWCVHSIAWDELCQGQAMEAQGMNWSSIGSPRLAAVLSVRTGQDFPQRSEQKMQKLGGKK